jgi:predicted AlkP superfamily pyrophosphatase or phosphodiesterase
MPLLDAAAAREATVVVLSEYGITKASFPVHVNRALRAEGLLTVYTQAGMEYLDPWTSRAFAVSDHQIAHIYVADPADLRRVHKLCEALPGVAQVLDESGKSEYGLDHARSGELVLIAEPEAWFTYYYWLDDAHAPDFARLVDIHRKPGYDPAELFFDPAGPAAARTRAAAALLRKRLGMRYLMNVVGLDAGAAAVRGTHGRLPSDPRHAPLLLCSRPGAAARPRYAAVEVKGLLLGLAGLTESA